MNDLVAFVMRRAARRFGGTDGVFNVAGFAQCFRRVVGLESVLDGEAVRGILCGRPDVRVLSGGAHFQILVRSSLPPPSDSCRI